MLSKLGWTCFVVGLILAALDVASTHYVLGLGGEESNPLMAACMKQFGVTATFVIKMFSSAIFLWFCSMMISGNTPYVYNKKSKRQIAYIAGFYYFIFVFLGGLYLIINNMSVAYELR